MRASLTERSLKEPSCVASDFSFSSRPFNRDTFTSELKEHQLDKEPVFEIIIIYIMLYNYRRIIYKYNDDIDEAWWPSGGGGCWEFKDRV